MSTFFTLMAAQAKNFPAPIKPAQSSSFARDITPVITASISDNPDPDLLEPTLPSISTSIINNPLLTADLEILGSTVKPHDDVVESLLNRAEIQSTNAIPEIVRPTIQSNTLTKKTISHWDAKAKSINFNLSTDNFSAQQTFTTNILPTSLDKKILMGSKKKLSDNKQMHFSPDNQTAEIVPMRPCETSTKTLRPATGINENSLMPKTKPIYTITAATLESLSERSKQQNNPQSRNKQKTVNLIQKNTDIAVNLSSLHKTNPLAPTKYPLGIEKQAAAKNLAESRTEKMQHNLLSTYPINKIKAPVHKEITADLSLTIHNKPPHTSEIQPKPKNVLLKPRKVKPYAISALMPAQSNLKKAADYSSLVDFNKQGHTVKVQIGHIKVNTKISQPRPKPKSTRTQSTLALHKVSLSEYLRKYSGDH